MGYYIKPPAGTKEEWLRENGTLLSSADLTAPEFPVGSSVRLICLVQNPAFSAAGIIYDEREFQDFSDPTNLRPKVWFLVDRDKLTPDVTALPAHL